MVELVAAHENIMGSKQSTKLSTTPLGGKLGNGVEGY